MDKQQKKKASELGSKKKKLQLEKQKQTIKIGYIDWITSSDFEHDWFYQLLSLKYRIELSDSPDYLFYGLFGNKHHAQNCTKIFWTGENTVPNFNCCDYALGFHHLTFGDRYMRLPLWRLYLPPETKTVLRKIPSDYFATHRKFCAMVVSNMKRTNGAREQFFEKLSAYKTVDSGGRYKNNVGGPVKDKKAFLKNYKFSLAFENTSSPGYCTEKLLQAFQAGGIPVYYGDPTVIQDFNPKAFINCHEYQSFDEVISVIRHLDEDDKAYLAMLKEPIFLEGKIPQKYSAENILSFFEKIFSQSPEQRSRCDFTKPYADVDYLHMKQREIVSIFIWYLFHGLDKLKDKIKQKFQQRSAKMK